MFLKQLKMVLVIRADLKLSKVGQPKIVLKVDSQSDLERLQKLARESGVTNTIVLDAGRTHIAPGTATCLGLGPDYDEKIDALVKDLKLL